VAVSDDEEKVRAERARAIGLFRYQLIREAADAALSTKEQGKMVRELASWEHIDPFGRRVRISRPSIDRWIRDWRAGGFDALVPNPRQCTPRTPAEALELAVALRREDPQRTAAAIRRILRTQLGWARPMNAPCNATSTGSASPAARLADRRRCSAGSKPSIPTTCGPGMRCTAYELRPVRRICSRF